MQQRLFSIDPGSHKAGFACLEIDFRQHRSNFGNIKLLEVGDIQLVRTDSHAKRIFDLSNVIAELMNEFRPHLCVIEKAFGGININTALRLGETRGAILYTLLKKKIEIFELTPAFVKKTITGSGRATKEEVALAVSHLIKLPNKKLSFDATDALALGLSHAYTSTQLGTANLY